MSQNGQDQLTSPTLSRLSRACDRCHKRKIRCDKTFPCAGCRSMGISCEPSKRPAIEKRQRVLISTQYEKKLDHLAEELRRVATLVEALHKSSSNSLRPTDAATPSQLLAATAYASNSQNRYLTKSLHTTLKDKASSDQNYNRENAVVVEGQSSLTAHSALGVDFMQNVADSSPNTAGSSQVNKLLNNLRNIVSLLKPQCLSHDQLFPLAQETYPGNCQGSPMPPIQAAFAVISNAQDESDFIYLCISKLLSPRSLSDLCMKLYCSPECSDAERIIVNAALYFLATERDTFNNDSDGCGERGNLQHMCRKNLETVLSRISLYLQGDYDMTLALVLGALYALDLSKTYLAWTLVNAASQCSYSLGFHSKPDNTEGFLNGPSQNELLFWTVYYLEKTLCLRLGRSSTIADCDISISPPERPQGSSSYHLDYLKVQLKLASVAARIYERLYSASAFKVSRDERARRAVELSQELTGYCEQAVYINQLWSKTSTNVRIREQILLIAGSDEVFRLSLLTLVNQAMPTSDGSSTNFSKECILSARKALDCHQTYMTELATKGLSVVTAYIHWTIFFAPFTPFIVLFCHVIEAGDVEDLKRMGTFVDSFKSACQYSSTIRKHSRLFSAFLEMALHYNKLKTSSILLQEEHAGRRTEVGWQLFSHGQQSQGSSQIDYYFQEASQPMSSDIAAAQGDIWSQNGLWGEDWFSFNQQVMGLIDQDVLPF
ncbi:hypothetical protein BDW68DRAFT_195376 [Aspergillus falconensis]